MLEFFVDFCSIFISIFANIKVKVQKNAKCVPIFNAPKELDKLLKEKTCCQVNVIDNVAVCRKKTF